VRELAIVLLVLSMTSGILLERVGAVRAEIRAAACDQNVTEMNGAIERWYLRNGSWPAPDLSDIGRDPCYFPSGIPRCPVNGAPYEIDKNTHRVLRHRHVRYASDE